MIQQIRKNIDQGVAVAAYAEQQGNMEVAFGQYGVILEALFSQDHIFSLSERNMAVERMRSIQRSSDVVHRFEALVLEKRGLTREACEEYQRACLLNPAEAVHKHCLAKALIRDLQFECARQVLGELAVMPGCEDVATEVSADCEATESMPGEDYYGVLARIHECVKPRTYLEIGLGHGKSLALSGDTTVALGVDPLMADWASLFFCRNRPYPKLYKMKSDDFFRQYTLREEMACDVCDMAFIDGLHVFEQVLMDFAHVERYCSPSSVIMLHDCLPVNPRVANRDHGTDFWTGDVWKVIPCLKAVRPDLNIVTIPTYPSGLAIITGLDPSSRVLARHFDEVVQHFVGHELPDSRDERYEMLNCRPDRDVVIGGLARP